MRLLARVLALLALGAALWDLLPRLSRVPALAAPERTTPAPGTASPDAVPFRPGLATSAGALATAASEAAEAPGAPATAPRGPLPAAPPPPRYLRAEIREDRILLAWQPPETGGSPRELRYRLLRWVGDGVSQVVYEGSATRWEDQVACPGLPHHYRLRALLDVPLLEGRRLLRESPAVAITVEPAPWWHWSATGLDPAGRILLLLEEPGQPPRGPEPAIPGREVAGTSWILKAVAFRETRVPVETRLPRFDALGRRVIINGRPADRVREDLESRILATVRLADPCGTAWTLELLLPRGSRLPEGE